MAIWNMRWADYDKAIQAMILAALVECLSDRPCYLPKLMMANNIIVEDRKLR
jgi:hypothetical protein